MNIQTTNTEPDEQTIQLATDHVYGYHPRRLFAHDGRIWRVVEASESEVTATWVPNSEVTRDELELIEPFDASDG